MRCTPNCWAHRDTGSTAGIGAGAVDFCAGAVLTRRRIKAAAGVLVAGLLLGVAPGASAEGADRQATAAGADIASDQVVIVGVPGLLTGDLASGLAPELTELAGTAALGQMSVRAARSRTCILDGWATLGAGNRARYPAPTVDTETNLGSASPQEAQRLAGLAGCGQQEQVALSGLTDVAQTVSRIAADEGTRLFGAEPGALGEAVSCSTAIGRSAAVAVAGPTAQVSIVDSLPDDLEALSAALSRCPLSLISMPQLIGTVPTISLDEPDGGPGPTEGPLPLPSGRPRGLALNALDQAIGDIRTAVAALPGDTLLLVVGLSEKGGSRAQLHPLIAAHPDLPAGYLTSSSTGRSPYVQLIDVAPTALRALGIANSETMVGSAVTWAGPSAGLSSALAELRDLNRAAVAHSGLTRTFFWTLVGLAAALVAALAIGTVRRSRGRGRSENTRQRQSGRVLRLAALAFAALPAATYLANLTPWWRSSMREVALGSVVVGLVVVLVGIAVLLGTRGGIVGRLLPAERRWTGPVLVLLLATAVTIGIDVVLGSPMELNALLGYNAIVAGRFVGLGNLTFGLFAASVLLAAALLVHGSRRGVTVRLAVVGLVAVLLVGAPWWGRDFGGVLALVPALLLLWLLATRSRLSVRRAVAIGAASVVVVSAFALLDYQRDADDRTHLGRFVAQLLDGQAWTVVARKAQASLDVLTGSPVTWLIPIFGIALWLLFWRRTALGELLAAEPAWRFGLVSCALCLGIGALINDSGVAVPAIAACLVVPLLIWVDERSATPVPAAATDPPRDTTIGDGVPDRARVSVNSREPTG